MTKKLTNGLPIRHTIPKSFVDKDVFNPVSPQIVVGSTIHDTSTYWDNVSLTHGECTLQILIYLQWNYAHYCRFKILSLSFN